jgi:hypothetical protein
VVVAMVADVQSSQLRHGGVAGGASRLAIRGEDAGENSSLLGTMLMAYKFHLLPEGDIVHL